MANILTHLTNGAIYFDDGTAGSSSIPALTGNAVSLNHDGSAGLNIVSKNTTSTDRFTIDGDSGRLFSVNDSLTGTIFSVNDASGLPIVEVESTSSEDTVTIGTYNTNALVVKGNLVGIGTSSPATNLHVAGAAPTLLVQSTSGGSATLEIGRTADTEAKIVAGDISAGDLNFYTNGTAALKILSNQNATFTGDVAVSGNLTAPTTGSGENSTKVATTAYVKGQNYITGSGIPTLSGSNSFTNSYNEFGNSTGSVSNDGSWNARLNLAGSSHARFDVKSVSDGIISTVYAHTGHGAGRFGTISNHKIEFITSGSAKATLNTDSTFYLGSDRVFADNYHPNADRLTSGRVITLGGDLSGSAEFTGAADITITAAVSNNSHTHTIANITSLQSSLDAKAALASPALTGNPTAPTQSANNNSTRIATTAYVQTEISDLIGGAPGALDTLNELAAAINDDASYASTITTALAGKLSTSGKAADSNLLDGIDSSAFLRSNANDDFSGTLNYTPDTGTILSVDGQAVIQRMTANGALTIGHDDAVIIAGGDTSGTLNSNINNATETVFVGAEGGFVAYAFPSNNTAWSNRKELNWNGTALTLLGNTVWHAGNDGSGSGLDADKLDGLQLNSDDRNDSANVVVRTQGNGYTYFGWINTTSGNNGTTAMDRIYASHDGFVRYYTPANFGSQIGSHISYNDLTNKPTIPSAYSLPAASSSTRGGVKIGYSENGKNYPVEVSSEKMYVNVPWTDTNTDTNTTYSAGTGLSLSGTTFSITDTISSSASNNTIVKRHSSGYIFANYFNTTPNTVSSGITQICVETGNDGYIRHGTAAAVRSFINVANGANNYSLPAGSSSTRGGFKIGYSENGKNYPVEVSSEKMYVNVPWSDTNTNTTYSAGTGISLSGTTFSLTDTASKLSLSGGTMSGNIVVNNYGLGNVGLYSATKYQGVWAMGTSYMLPSSGGNTGSLYGLAWTHTNIGGQSKSGLSHQLLVCHNGTTKSAIGSGIWTDGTITTTGHGTSANWNTAYGWGNHASAGYVTSSGNTVIGTDSDIDTSGATVIDQLNMTDGVIQSHSTRTLTLANLGYTGATNANNYSLPAASSSTRGGVKIGYPENGKYYPVELSSEKMYVHVPWTDTNTNTTYSAGRGLDLSGTQFQLETDLRDSVSHIGYDSGDYIQWSVNSYFRSVVNGSERFRVNTTGIDVTGLCTANTFRTDTGNADYNLITRNNTSSTLYVQAAGSASTQPIASFRYGSATAGAGTEVLAVRRNSSYFNNTKLGVGLTNPGSTLSVSGGVAIGASYASSSSPSNGMLIQGNVGIGTSSVSGYYALQVNGNIQGSYKSFVIDHPTKENTQLAHACIEGPEIGVYFRGKSTSDTIVVADYWDSLVDIDSMTVDLTAIGQGQDLFVSSIKENGDVVVGTNTDKPLNYYYVVYGERKDINKLVVEFEIEENDDEEESIAESPNVVDTDSVEYINP